MLAASVGRTNVSPDDVQTTPVTGLLAIRAYELGENTPGTGFQANPSHPSQQDTAGDEARRMPLKIRPTNLDCTIRSESQRYAAGPGTAENNKFPESSEAPQRGACSAQSN